MIDLKLLLGTVNYNDYIRVAIAKVSDPGTEIFVQYVDVPVTSYALVAPNLEPTNYWVRFYDSPGDPTIGTLISEAFYNGMTGEFEYERRFYTIGSLASGVTNTDYLLNDPYLAGKNVTGVFKEAFRYLEKDNEWTFDDTTGDINLIPDGGPQMLSNGEKFIVELKYRTGSAGTTTAAGVFQSTIIVTDEVYTVLAVNKFKRHSLESATSKQRLTMPALSSVSIGDFFYFEHKRGGLNAQSSIVFNGTDKLYYNGFSLPGGNLLIETWVNKGASIYLRKEVISATSYWEIILGWNGIRVGECIKGLVKTMPLLLPKDGRLLDGDEYPGLWFFLSNVLPITHVVIDDTVVNGGYSHPAAKKGMFVKHSSLKKFRLPNDQGFSDKALNDFNTYGGDATRNYDYPGGTQDQRIMKHRHLNKFKNGKSDQTESGTQDRFFRELVAGGDNYGTIDQFTLDTVFALSSNTDIGGNYNIVNNIGQINFIHI